MTRPGPAGDQAGRGRAVALETLRIRDFRFLWLSNGLAVTALQLRTMGQAWLVLELTDSSLWVGAANSVPVLVVVAFSLLGGVLADRLDRRAMLLFARVSLAGMAFVLAFLVTSGSVELWHILAIAVAAGGVNSVGTFVSQVLVFDVVGERRLLSAVALGSVVSSVGNVVGPSIGGVLIARYGAGSVFYLVGGAYAVGVVALLLVAVRRRTPARRRSMLRSLMEGVTYARRTPLVALLLGIASLGLFGAIYFPMVPVYARDVLGVGSRGYGYLLGAYGAGAMVGALSLILIGNVRRRSMLVLADAIIWGAGMAVFALSRDFRLSIASGFAMGVTSAFWVSGLTTLLQGAASDEVRGRVMSLYTVTMQVVSLGWLLGGALATVFSPRTALLVGAVGYCAPAVVAFWRSARLRNA